LGSDVFSPAERSAVMRRVKGKNTGPELALRQILTRMGLRYRLHRKDLPGAPDIAFIGRKTAIFMHGCFWHGHDCRRGARQPKANADYWIAKIGRNRARDLVNTGKLLAMGWRPVVVWECELKDLAVLEEKLSAILHSAHPREGGDQAEANAPVGSADRSGVATDADDPSGSPPSRG
jgi:DNA mismatch endonuclease (patch repair protein)